MEDYYTNSDKTKLINIFAQKSETGQSPCHQYILHPIVRQ